MLIYNAACHYARSYDQLVSIAQSDSDIVLTKTCSLLPKRGNTNGFIETTDGCSFNNLGCPNEGIEYYLSEDPTVGTSKEYHLSILPECVNVEFPSFVSGIEVNVSCPNTSEDPIGFSAEKLKNVLDLIRSNRSLEQKTIALKLPYFSSKNQFDTIANTISDSAVTRLVCCNTIPGLYRTEFGFVSGGYGGAFAMPFSLKNVAEFRTRLPTIEIIGCGGVETCEDANDYIAAGANGVQIATGMINYGLGIFATVRAK